jgi:peptidyl-prolyl cis-trans isomerase D
MLQKIHDHMKGIVTVVLFGILAIVFIFWGTRLDTMSTQTYAARVNGEKISLEEVRRAYQEQTTQFERQVQGELPAALKEQVRDNVIEAYIHQQLLLQRTGKLHYRVSTEDVMRSYRSQEAFQIDGKFSPELALRRLQVARLTPAQWEANTRQSMQIAQLQDAVAVSQFVTPSEIAHAAALNFEQRELSFAVVPAARYAASINPSDADVNTYYQAHKGEFLSEETVALEYVELKRDDLAAQQTVTEADLRKYYEENKDRYTQKERRRARHILVRVAKPEEDVAAHKKADDLYQKLKAGADFAAFAKQFSDDPGSQTTGGDLGLQESGGFVKAFDDAVFSMQLHELHAPLKTEYGYHIIRLDEIAPAKQKTFEEARAELDAEYRRNGADRDFGERQEKLADLAFSQSGDLGALARQMNFEIRRIAQFTHSAGGAPLGANKAVITAAFSDDVLNGRNSEPIEIAPGDVVVLRASGHKAAEPRPLADVRADIVAQLKNERGRRAAQEAGDAALAILNKGTVWDQALKDLDIAPSARQYVKRSDTTLPQELRDALFKAPRPQGGRVVYRGVAVTGGDYALLAFSGVRDDSSAEAATERANRIRELAARSGIGDMAAYTAELERNASIERNPKALE